MDGADGGTPHAADAKGCVRLRGRVQGDSPHRTLLGAQAARGAACARARLQVHYPQRPVRPAARQNRPGCRAAVQHGAHLPGKGGELGGIRCIGPPGGTPRPSFPKIQKANQDSEKPAGEWNEANIFVKNGVITVYINGVYQNTGTNKVKEGYIGLQSEGKEVQFRNVTITPW